MGLNNERQGRPRRPWFSTRRPTREQIADADALIDGLHKARAVSDFERQDLHGAVNAHRVTDPVIDVDELSKYGSKRISNLINVVESSPGYGKLPEESLASLKVALDLAEEAEARLRDPLITRRTLLTGFGVVAAGGLIAIAYSQLPPPDRKAAAIPKESPTSAPVIPTQSPVATFQTAAKPAEARPAQVPTRVPTVEVKPTPEPTKIPVSPEVIAEQQAWKKVLGADVEVKPFPSYITPEVKGRLDFYGLKLMYLPKLELGTLDDLQKKGTSRYLDGLQARYTNWRHFERMSPAEKANHEIPRNLEEEGFWLPIIDGKIEFPNLPGQWVAVERLRKPNIGQFYEKTKLLEELNIQDERYYERLRVGELRRGVYNSYDHENFIKK